MIIAVISPDVETTQQVVTEISRLSATLSLHVNNSKIEIDKWISSTTNEIVRWEGVPHKVRPPPPILRYLGHLLAHPSWAYKAKSDYLGVVHLNLAQYLSIPFNGWQGAKLVWDLTLD